MASFDADVSRHRRRVHKPSGAVLIIIAFTSAPASAQWPQWGGPNRNFTAEPAELADEWPGDGPRKLWHRELGDGYSSVVVDDGLLYATYRKEPTDELEFTVALSAKTGKTVWEHRNPAPLMEPPDGRWGGQGPNSTPLVAGNHLYTIGSRAVVHCFDKKTGEVIWEHDLVGEFDAPVSASCGYCCSPVAYERLVIAPVNQPRAERTDDKNEDGAAAPTLVAFDQADGQVIWRSLSFEASFSSPILISYVGEDQLVLQCSEVLLGVNPRNGELLWQHPLAAEQAVLTPVWNGEDLLFCSALGENARGQVVKLSYQDGKTACDELWQSRKVAFVQPTPVLIEDLLIGSSSRFLIGADLRSGKRLWLERGFPTATCVAGDGKLFVLDENGRLSLLTATTDGVTIRSQCQITERYSFSTPALVGTTLYVRDRKHIMALDVGVIRAVSGPEVD